MIIPMQSGKTVIPVHIPTPTSSGTLQQSNSEMQYNESVELTLGGWIMLGVCIVFVIICNIVVVRFLVKILKI